MAGKWLTKSRYLNGLQCPKLLWISANEAYRMPEVDAATQQLFDQGHEVGDLAKQLFPDGMDVPTGDFIGNIRLTRDLLSQRRTLFESGIQSGRLYSRLDVLKPVDDNKWDIYEVKSSTSVKDVNIEDASFQKYVCEKNGIKINRVHLVYLNNKYVRHGEINPEELFSVEDITERVAENEEGLREVVDWLQGEMDSPVCPEMGFGQHCNKPYDCNMLVECRAGLPEHSVFTLYRGGEKSHKMYRAGILDIRDITPDYTLNEKQQIQFDALTNDEVHLDKEKIREFLSSLVYPLYYFDFETIGPAVPLFDDSSPYQNIPFQYSLHVQETPGAKTEHFEFLAEGQNDPRPALLEKLHNELGTTGSVIAYNKSFEQKRLEEMASVYPEYADWVADVNARMIDLIVPFRGFHYYNPTQKGSASLKYVMPAVVNVDYNNMDIGEGGEASRRFMAIANGTATPEEAKQTLKSLLLYCGQDTEGMVWIIDELWKMVS